MRLLPMLALFAVAACATAPPPAPPDEPTPASRPAAEDEGSTSKAEGRDRAAAGAKRKATAASKPGKGPERAAEDAVRRRAAARAEADSEAESDGHDREGPADPGAAEARAGLDDPAGPADASGRSSGDESTAPGAGGAASSSAPGDRSEDAGPSKAGSAEPGPAAPAPSPRVLLIGDSMVVAELGRDMSRVLEGAFSATVRRRGKSSSGLARPDFFDWFGEGARLAEAHAPDVVVVIIGGNDGQDLVDEEGRGRIRWRTDGWPDAYAARIHRFLDAMKAEGRRFVWVELPAMDHRNLENKLQLIRRVQREALAQRSDVLGHVDTQSCFYDRRGGLLTQIPAGPKKGRDLRQEDGIHFSLFGARWVSRCLAPQLVELLERQLQLTDERS